MLNTKEGRLSFQACTPQITVEESDQMLICPRICPLLVATSLGDIMQLLTCFMMVLSKGGLAA